MPRSEGNSIGFLEKDYNLDNKDILDMSLGLAFKI